MIEQYLLGKLDVYYEAGIFITHCSGCGNNGQFLLKEKKDKNGVKEGYLVFCPNCGKCLYKDTF